MRYRRVGFFLTRATLIPSSSKTFVEEKERRRKRKKGREREVRGRKVGPKRKWGAVLYEVTSPQISLLFFLRLEHREGLGERGKAQMGEETHSKKEKARGLA